MIGPHISGDVLDIGCGKGHTLKLFGDKIENYTGIEHDPERVEALRKQFPNHQFFAKDLDEDSLDLNGQFDTILMIALVEHIYNLKFFFKEALSCMKPSGQLVITTPTPFGNDIVHKLGSKIGLFSKVAADDHIVIFNKKRFQILAGDFDLNLHTYKQFQLGCNQLVVLRRNGG